MLNKKGMVIPTFGTVLIVAAVIFLFVLSQTIETKQRTIMFKGELAISGQNQMEINKKFAELSFNSLIEGYKSIYLCDTPEFFNDLKFRLPSGIQELDKFRTILWAEPEFDGEFAGDIYNIKGYQTMIFKDSRIEMTIRMNVTYDANYNCGG